MVGALGSARAGDAAIAKTNAVRLLEARGVAHRLTIYDPAGAFHSADEAAALLKAPPESVYKSLVAIPEGAGRARPLLVLIACDRQLDLKALARSLGLKRVRMAGRREAEELTGLEVGGISALALRPGAFQVLLDAPAEHLDRIHVSAGVRGADLELAVADLVALTGARFVEASSAGGTAG